MSYEVDVRSDGRKELVMGSHPTGYAYSTPDGRDFFKLTGEGRKPAQTDAERAALLATQVFIPADTPSTALAGPPRWKSPGTRHGSASTRPAASPWTASACAS